METESRASEETKNRIVDHARKKLRLIIDNEETATRQRRRLKREAKARTIIGVGGWRPLNPAVRSFRAVRVDFVVYDADILSSTREPIARDIAGRLERPVRRRISFGVYCLVAVNRVSRGATMTTGRRSIV